MTSALGFAISRSRAIGDAILSTAEGDSVRLSPESRIALELSRTNEGRTDIEIDVPGKALVVIEAKSGVELPSADQIALYLPRLREAVSEGRKAMLLLLTSASTGYAQSELRARQVSDVEVRHLSWHDVMLLVERSVQTARGNERVVAREYLRYLQRGEEMDTRRSNMVYVVALAEGNPVGWRLGWQDVVRNRLRYFYPVGSGGWPDPPPNYIGFRFAGRLQSIHHVESYEVFVRPKDLFPEAGQDEIWPPHYCLKLGPAMTPPGIVKTGPSVVRAARVWCMLDTLLTMGTLTEAMKETKRRLETVA